MDEQKENKLKNAIYNFFIDIFSNGVIDFLRKAIMIGFGVLIAVIILLFVGWKWAASDNSYESKHLLKPELKITVKDHKADTTYVYHFE